MTQCFDAVVVLCLKRVTSNLKISKLHQGLLLISKSVFFRQADLLCWRKQSIWLRVTRRKPRWSSDATLCSHWKKFHWSQGQWILNKRTTVHPFTNANHRTHWYSTHEKEGQGPRFMMYVLRKSMKKSLFQMVSGLSNLILSFFPHR